jgi:hypothetical protein
LSFEEVKEEDNEGEECGEESKWVEKCDLEGEMEECEGEGDEEEKADGGFD